MPEADPPLAEISLWLKFGFSRNSLSDSELEMCDPAHCASVDILYYQ